MTRAPGQTPAAASLLERFTAEIDSCVRCGSCRTVCPSFGATLDESFSARGRMALVRSVLDRRTPLSAVYRERLATCTGCLACETVCPSSVPVTEIIQAAREAAVREQGAGLIGRIVSAALSDPRLMRSLAWFAPILLHYTGSSLRGRGPRHQEEAFRNRARGKRREQQKGTVAFFPGCAIGSFQRDVGRAAAAVLTRAGYDVVVPAGLQCCGRPLLSLGDRRAAEAAAGRNTAVLEAAGADAVVTACASCGLTFKKEYPTLLALSGREPVPVLDIHEFLAVQEAGIGTAPFRMRITWHDPCHLGRGQGLSQTAKSVLRSLPGVELVEMDSPDRCCGFGGVMRIAQSGMSDAIGRAKAEDIMATGADAVVTGCPGCRMQIAESLRRAGSSLDVLHTVQVIEKACLSDRSL